MIELSENISNYIQQHFGKEFLERYKEFHSGAYKPFLRFSPSNTSQETIIKNLERYGIVLEKIDGIPNAYRITKGGGIVGKTLEFILGKYYIQSLSSMFPALALNPIANDKVLDLCAAPGSKTTQLAELMNNKGTLIANEISLERLKSLVFNIDKMSLVNVGVLNYKGELLSKIFENVFDKILVDAPCSALGITQKKGEVSNWWNVNKAKGLSEVQFKLLLSAIKMVRVGGEIVYSTCTLALEENELVINKILKKYPVELVKIDLPVKSNEGFTKFGDEPLNQSIKKTHRILPWEIDSEGFFVAKLKKFDVTEPTARYPRKEKKQELIKSSSGKIKGHLEKLSQHFGISRNLFDEYKYLVKGCNIYFVNSDWECYNLELFNRIGTKLGSVDKRGIIQLYSLAAQVFGEAIIQNIEHIENTGELDIYFSGGTIKKVSEVGGQRVVKFGDYILGTAVASKEGLKSQFPRAFRTQEIVLK